MDIFGKEYWNHSEVWISHCPAGANWSKITNFVIFGDIGDSGYCIYRDILGKECKIHGVVLMSQCPAGAHWSKIIKFDIFEDIYRDIFLGWGLLNNL